MEGYLHAADFINPEMVHAPSDYQFKFRYFIVW